MIVRPLYPPVSAVCREASSISQRANQAIDGLTLVVPAGWQLAEGPPGTRQDETRVVVGAFADIAQLQFSAQ